MKDTIYKEDAIKALRERWARTTSYDGIGEDIGEECEEVINAIPSADRPQGKWLIEKTLYDNYNYRCSYCDWYECHAYPDVEPYNYCPHCGARMKGADDDSKRD